MWADPGAASGYLHPAYAAALADVGEPRALPGSGGFLLVRPIPGSACRDALGCYPLFACRDWSRLGDDLEAAGRGLVAVSLVTDPFGGFAGEPALRRCFPDLVRPFKEHWVVDLSRPLWGRVSDHHRRSARRALAAVAVERCPDPPALLADWLELYAALVARHGIRGIPAFSAASFARQLAVPGLVAFRAVRGGATVAMALFYVQEGRAYYHLGASSAAGYEHRASFALFWTAIEHFAAAGLEELDLGAGAGVEGNGSEGLGRFKRGWATGTRTAWLCGRIFDRARYADLASERGGGNGWFPAYRWRELA